MSVAALLLGVGGMRAQQDEKQPDEKKKEEGLPLKSTRKVSFTTDEGTWLSLDVSPNGEQIVFDLLGDLYLLPIAGGDATRITSGPAWDCQPRFSPDGSQIAFISDRGGSDNIWLLNADGRGEPRAVTKETDASIGSPAWSPDGNYLVARKWGPYPAPDNYLLSVDLWLFHKDGGKGVLLVRGRGRNQINAAPTFSPDGTHIYFSTHAGAFNYNADIGRFQVARFDRDTGEINTLTAEYGGGLRPLVSPDGKWLVYASRHDAVTGLRIRDLATRDDHWLTSLIQRDDQEGFTANDLLPGYAFTPDSKSVVFTADGRIKRVELATRRVGTIPFNAKVDQDLGPLVHQTFRVDEAPLSVRHLRWINQSPDGKRVVFSAVGKIWIADLPAGTPRRLTKNGAHEFEPSFSPDGQSIVFVSWSDAEGGHLWKAPVSGGDPVRLDHAAALYEAPRWSPDGQKILFITASVAGWLAGDSSDLRELAWMPGGGGEIHRIVTVPGGAQAPEFSGDGTRVYYMEAATPAGGGSDEPQRPARLLRSIRIDGVDKRTHLRFEGNSVVAVPSPDGAWVALENEQDAYLVALPKVGSEVPRINFKSPDLPVRRVTLEGATDLRWADGGRTLTWGFGPRFFRVSRDEVVRSSAPDKLKPQEFGIALQVPRHAPKGELYLTGARVVTMKGGSDPGAAPDIIERGDILIENNRIKAVAPRGKMRPPPSARVINVHGKTILPGFVDIHSHMGNGRDVLTDQLWAYAANLAYGVTTTRNPSADSTQVFTAGEMVEAGELVGPRIYSTGTAMTTYNVTIATFEEANHIVRRYKAHGADSLKQYMQPRRIVRQWLAMAAAKEGVNITAEGAGDHKLDISMVLDGYTGFEHSLPVQPVYKDVTTLVAQAKTTYTPTLIVSYGAEFGQYYWRQRMNIHDDAKLRRFTPHTEIDRKSRRRPMLLDEEYNFPLIAKGAAEILKGGGRVGLGSHGEQQGIGAHWELWMLQSGGLSPWQALRAATVTSAEGIGLFGEVGSLEPGKLADLIVLRSNPLTDIRNSLDIEYVVKNGEVFAGNTLDEIWPVEKKFPPFIWQKADAELHTLVR